MKKRVLFVDDEPAILQGLQRLLRGMRDEWDMQFVESGAKALELMQQSPTDVVVTDMRMPGMNGAELLNTVMQRYPKTVRFILSGHSDTDLILKCVGSTHQYLSKPCEPDALRQAVQRATTLDAALRSETLRKLVAQMSRLPSIPELYLEVMEAARDPDASASDIGSIIARDLGMTATILKLVNSAFFGLRRPVADPVDAVNYIGLDPIKALILSVKTFSQFDAASQCPGFSADTLWSHSMDTAAWAKRIAQMEVGDRKVADEAFTGGMLHDAGKLVLAANFTPEYSEALDLAARRHLAIHEAEEQVFGASHADVGGYLFGLWGLPVPVVEVIALHHSPARSADRDFGPLAAVHAANALAHEAGQGEPASGNGNGVSLDEEYLKSVHAADRVEAWRAALGGGGGEAPAP